MSIIKVDEIGSYQFAVTEVNDIDILHSQYRIICEKCIDMPNSAGMLLPEVVQVLFENGFATVRRLVRFPDSLNSTICKESTEAKDGELRLLAKKVLIGRKIKAQKRKALGSEAGASKLKVRKSDSNLYSAENSDLVLESELNAVMEELCASGKLSERQKRESSVQMSARSSCYETVNEPDFPHSLAYQIRLVTFRDLWRKGFYLTCGSKFGCDYLAYEKPPGEVHSTYMVICLESSEDTAFRPLDFIAASRVASQVKKQILLSIVSTDSLIPYYINAMWWKGNK